MKTGNLTQKDMNTGPGIFGPKTEAALKDVKGVTTVTADKNKHQVKVTYDDAKVKRADLEKAIADSGFAADK